MARALAGLVALLVAGCFVPELTVMDDAQGGGGAHAIGGSGGSFVPVDCEELFSAPAWSDACRTCIQGSTCCTDIADACGADEACVAAAQCLAERFNPVGPKECSETHSAYLYYVRTALFCSDDACAEECSGSNWQCAGNWSGFSANEGTSAFITLRLHDSEPVDAEPAIPIVGASVDICTQNDADCVPPLQSKLSSSLGGAQFPVEFPFRDHFAVEAADYGRWRVFVPEVDYPSLPEIRLTKTTTIESIAADIGLTVDWGKAQLFVSVLDCLHTSAPNVAIEVDSRAADPIYLDGLNGVLGNGTFRDNGTALLLNADPVPPSVTVRAIFDETEVAHANVYLEAGAITYVVLEPTRN